MASNVSQASSLKSKVSSYFGAHGRFCASHPWEVIVSIVTLTVCALSMSVLSGGKVGTVCGFSKPCEPKPADEEVSKGRQRIICLCFEAKKIPSRKKLCYYCGCTGCRYCAVVHSEQSGCHLYLQPV